MLLHLIALSVAFRAAAFLLAADGSLTTCSRADAGAWFNYPFLTSKERDNETQLDYFEARYYGSSQGRFTSVDPFMGSGRTFRPESWNRYAYVLNNPLRLVDPSGMEDREAQQVVNIGKDKKINRKIDEIQKAAKPIDQGVAPVPTQAITIAGEQTVLDNATIIGPDGQALGSGVNGYMQPVALVVLDQGGNIMKAPDDMFVVENAKPENDAAKQEVAAGRQLTSNEQERGQSSNGAFYDLQVRGLGSKPLDLKTTQDVTVRHYFGPKPTDYKEIFQITGNKIRFNDVKKQVTFTPGTTKKL